MNIDFRKVPVEDVTGEITEMDMAIVFGNYVYNNTTDIADMDLAKKIYYDGQIELSEEQRNRIINLIHVSAPIVAKFRIGLLNILNTKI